MDQYYGSHTEAAYNSYFPEGSGPGAVGIGFPQYPQSTGAVWLEHLLPYEDYLIEYYNTNGTSAGIHDDNYDYLFTTDAAGQAYLTNAPPTDVNAADWAYVVTKVTFMRKSSNPVSIGADHTFTVQPNPSSGVFLVKGKEIENAESVMIYDIYGKMLLSFEGKQKNEMNIDLTQFASGLYFLKVKFGDEIITKQIIKQ